MRNVSNRFMTLLAACAALALAAPPPARAAAAPPPADFRLGFTARGPTQGDLTIGDASGINGDEAPACSVMFKMNTPVDPASHRFTGKRVHAPVRIVKRTSTSSLRFALAMASNESLTVVITWYAVGTGTTAVRQMKLTNARLAEFQTWQGSCDGSVAPEPGETSESITLVYDRLDWKQFDPPIDVTLQNQ